MPASVMEICPMCAMCPRLAGRWRPQVRCSCGACGPRTSSREEAIGRWNSVVDFVQQLKARGVADMLERRAPSSVRRLARRIAWQCGLEPYQGR